MNIINSMIKKQALKIFIGGGLFMILIGLAMVYVKSPELFKYIFAKNTPDLFQSTRTDYIDNKWFSCDNNLLYGYFAEDNYGRYYVTSTNDGEYFGFYVYKSDIEKADKISEDTFAYFQKKSNHLSEDYLSGKGYMRTMDAYEKKYFDEYFSYDGNGTSDYKLIHTVFYLTGPKNLLFSNGSDSVLIFIGFILIIIGIVCIGCFLFGGNKKAFRQCMQKYGILEEVLERDMENSFQLFDKAFYGKEHLVLVSGYGHVIPYDQMIWAYYKITNTNHKVYGVIPAGTTTSYQVIFYDRKGTQFPYTVKNEFEATSILEKLHTYAPYVLIGYSDEISRAVTGGRFIELINAVDAEKRRLEQTAETANYEETSQDAVMTYNEALSE